MKERKGEHPWGDSGQLLLLVVFTVIWVSDTFVYHWSTFLAARVPQAIRMGLLTLALLATFLLIRTGHVVISGKERPNHVVDTGAFHFVRHPLYLAALLAYLGTALSSLSLISLAVLVPGFLFYDYIASYEERLLEAKLGQPYFSYEARTGKWLPFVGRRALPL
ncbi:MAG TPA: methyltransferase [Anaerolineales bacterium]|nr:methyltransferase [Anaerolineales bacterium]